MRQILIYSTLSGLATAVGGLIAIAIGKPSRRIISLFLGFAAGVMLGVACFDLIPNALEYSTRNSTVLGFGTGIILMLALEQLIPHIHKAEVLDQSNSYMKMGYFVALGIALHNLPEGIAIGAGFEAAPELGGMIAMAIALHNIPEGLGLSVPLKVGGEKYSKILLICLLAGLFTPIGTVIGSLFIGMSSNFIGIGLSFAAGAMLYIVGNELIPECHQHSNVAAILGIGIGVIITLLAL